MQRSPAIAIALAAQALLVFPAQPSPEQKAIQYLAREVPRWNRENHCFSCHNNGDGARALQVAIGRGYSVPDDALLDTTRWLLKPADWDNNGGNSPMNDKKLARIQFAAALAQGFEASLITDRRALIEAAESLLPYQEKDGRWSVDAPAETGSPVTYGTALATYMARRTLETAASAQFTRQIARANDWLLSTKPRGIVDAAAKLPAFPHDGATKRECLALVLPAQTSDGGWGPFPFAPGEPFDTAIALIALRGLDDPQKTRSAITRGRAYLIATQQADGGWPETTRPPGQQSYAQRISTSSWATIALVLSDSKR